MNRMFVNVLILLIFLLVSCENTVNGKVDIASDEDSKPDSEQIDDADSTDDADETDDPVGTDDYDEADDPGWENEFVSDLKIEANDKNVLSCRLSFSTFDVRRVFVKYFSATHMGYKLTENSVKNYHYFFLWGMREDENYTIEIYDADSGKFLATTEFHSGILPEYVHKPTLVTNEKKEAFAGFFLFAQTTDKDDPQIPLIIMVDREGFVVWYYLHDIAGVAYLDDPEFIKKTNTIFTGVHKYPSMDAVPAEEGIEIDLEGNIVWKSPDLFGSFYKETSWHHEYKLLGDGTIMFLKAFYSNNIIVDRIVNVDRNYTELWSWGYFDSPDYFSTVECPDPNAEWCDWTHTNSAMMFKDDGILYFNSLYLGFFKMDMKDKKVLWKFGKDGDFTMLSQHDHPWTDGTHDPKFADAGRTRLLFFDNGIGERNYSRVIEYEIDEKAMTAEITFEYDGIDSNHGWFSSGWGDADYLENGNILVTKGFHDNNQAPSVFEITRDKKVVWELYLWRNGDKVTKLYNSSKFMPPLEFLKEESVSGLKVEANEKNSLSCRLNFSTSEAKKTYVKYYSAMHSGYKIVEDSAKTDHYFFLWGMRENLSYKIEIYDEKTSELLATTEFHSGEIPDFVYQPWLVTNEKRFVQPGFVLFSQTTNDENPDKIPLIMVDNDGFVVWYYQHEIGGLAYLEDAQYIEKTKTIFAGIHKYPSMADIPAEEGIEIDLEGNIVWKSPDTTDYYYGEKSWHHEYRLLENDTILFFRAHYQDDYLLYDSIVNVDRNYNELWRWSYTDSPDYFGTVECGISEENWCDWTHTNFATVSFDDSALYFNSRYLGFYKLDMNTKKVLWKFGKDGDFRMLSENDFPWPDSAHSPKFFDETRKKVLFYDNGLKERGLSRIIEYEIDE